MKRVWEWSPTLPRVAQDISRWPNTIDRIIDAEGAKLPEKKKSKRNPTREFRGPPDCPLTDAMMKRKFADLDPETVRRAVPPKKRAVAETLGKSARTTI